MEGFEVLVGFIAFAALVIVWAVAPSKPAVETVKAPSVAIKRATA
ncbi:MAG: hypothetical protein HW416_2240 [Chloroflexi bacterium]|nr:hypothetical protein [Chloroflexota bacterium]